MSQSGWHGAVGKLAPLLGKVAVNPLRVISEIGQAIGDAATQQQRALDLFQTFEDNAVAPGTEAWMLNPMRSPVPFQFRDAEIRDFQDWFDDTSNGSWLKCRMVTGGPGRGKTRLVHEFLKEVTKSSNVNGGFIDTTLLSEEPERLAGFLSLKGDFLFAVDYAERFIDVVALLLLLAIAMRDKAKEGGERRIRLLLIVRKEPEEFARLSVRYPKIQEFGAAIGGGFETVALEPIAEAVSDRQAAFDTAFEAFDGKLAPLWNEGVRKPIPAVRPPLGPDAFNDALLIHIAAIAAWHEGTEVDLFSEDKLIDWLLDRERRYWWARGDRIDPGFAGEPLEQAAIMFTSVSLGGEGIQTRERAIELLRGCPLLADQEATKLLEISRIFRELYPGPAWVNGVVPDLLGQRLILMGDDSFLE